MTQARSQQIALEATSYYHCYVRCVRRAYLCGYDRPTGRDFEHRKQWIVSRLRFLSYIYAIDICAYAVMSNHYHVVLHIDAARANGWSNGEVAERWMQLYNGHLLVSRWLENPAGCDKATVEKVEEIIADWRERLCSISWFMRGVNESIARMANEEEGCKGRFWEGRFKSQALLDDAALLSCMAYVDLNPIRAGVNGDTVTSDFTSVQQRLFDYAKEKHVTPATAQALAERENKQHQLQQDLKLADQPQAPLMLFDGSSHTSIHTALPFTREDYFDLVDETGRAIRDDKRGFIGAEVPPIISRLGIDPDKWLEHVQGFGRRYGVCAGSADRIRKFAQHFSRGWGKGTASSSAVYGPSTTAFREIYRAG